LWKSRSLIVFLQFPNAIAVQDWQLIEVAHEITGVKYVLKLMFQASAEAIAPASMMQTVFSASLRRLYSIHIGQDAHRTVV
jgi:hypothetical protein